jgi:hypothetical protein
VAVSSLHSQQVLGHLADLPIPVVETASQSRLDLRSFECGQGHRGPSPDGRLIAEGFQDGGQSFGVADGAESRHRRLPAEGIGMAG